MKLESQLTEALKKAFLDQYQLSLEEGACPLQLTRKEFEGTFSLAVFPYAKRCNHPPAQMADAIGRWLQTHTALIASYNVIGGFLNLVLQDYIWLSVLKEVLQNPDYGQLPKKDSRVVVEFSCPNTNKPQHLGHLRNNFLGNALANLLQAAGHTVYKVNLINDRGIHICKSMVAYQQFGAGETPEGSGLKGDHLVGKYYVLFDQVYKEQLAAMEKEGLGEAPPVPPILQAAQRMLVAWEQGDPCILALWQKMNGWVYEGFNATYNQLGISFDTVYYESDTYLLGKKVVEEGLQKKVFYRRTDGAVAIDLTAQGLDEKVVLRSDGTAVYITQDLGTADLRYADYRFDKMIYVVGNEQEYHFKVLFSIIHQLGRVYRGGMQHLTYGMIELPDGKMKSREGNVVDADQLIGEMIDTVRLYTEQSNKIEGLTAAALQALHHMLAMGALKFFLLRVVPQKKMLFNPKESIDFQGDTGTFIQYTYARICSLERKAMGEACFSLDGYHGPLGSLEQAILFQLYRFPHQIEEAVESYMPSILANYALELAKLYNKFYAAYPIVREANPALRSFRRSLSAAVGTLLKKSMNLLGIDLPEQM
ncbi:MAG TPA: arginine--tRNA ligase [Amoebophilaceae bacterium]|jgi:arginyl-tRNA synthetase|nr:arginine--tRNA ligase [Amoebophilaceae bacterium]